MNLNFFLAKDLEDVFLQLSEEDILGLGFNVDNRRAIGNAYLYLEFVKIEIDRENAKFAQKLLETFKGTILELGDENLSLECEMLETRCLQKFEKVEEAREKYKNISKRYPEDTRPLFHLAEICLSEKDFDKNNEFLEKAGKIDSEFWLLKLEQILRKQNLGEKVDISNVDENAFPDDPKIKASFYRLYGLLLENSGDQTNADRFLGKAIHLNPDRFISYLDELSLIERRMLACQDDLQRLEMSQLLLAKIEKVESRFLGYGDIGARNKINLNVKN